MSERSRECPHLSGCPMFPMFSLQSTLEVWKISYCQAGFETCERFKRSKRGEPVANNLMPNGSLLRRSGRP